MWQANRRAARRGGGVRNRKREGGGRRDRGGGASVVLSAVSSVRGRTPRRDVDLLTSVDARIRNKSTDCNINIILERTYGARACGRAVI